MLGLAFASLACVACHDNGPPANAAATNATASSSANPNDADSNEIVVHAEDDGKSFDVARGSTVTFVLPSNAGTGYIWMPTQVDAGILVQQGDRATDLSSGAPGAPTNDVYHFSATNPGTTTVEMSLKRPFGNQTAGRVVHVTVHVR